MLPHSFWTPVAGEAAISDCSDRKLTKEIASVPLRRKPLAERWLCRLWVIVAIGMLPIGELKAPRILEVLEAIEKRGAIETAKRIRQRMSGVFVHAISAGIAETDPAA